MNIKKSYLDKGFFILNDSIPLNLIQQVKDLYFDRIKTLDNSLNNKNFTEEAKLPNIHLEESQVKELVNLPIITDRLKDLFKNQVDLESTSFFAKAPGSIEIVPDHQDRAGKNDFIAKNYVSVWIALTSSNKSNGCMHVYEKSHLKELKHDWSSKKATMLTQKCIPPEGLKKSFIELEPGQICFHHGLTIHGSSANPSDSWRIGLVIRYRAKASFLQKMKIRWKLLFK